MGASGSLLILRSNLPMEAVEIRAIVSDFISDMCSRFLISLRSDSSLNVDKSIQARFNMLGLLMHHTVVGIS